MKYLLLALLFTGCTQPNQKDKSCLQVLVNFLGPRSGINHNFTGNVISSKEVLFYTWFTKTSDERGIPVEYIAAASSSEYLDNEYLKPHGTCTENGKKYTLFKAKGHIR